MSVCIGVALFALAIATFGAFVVYRDLCRRDAAIAMALSTLDNIDRNLREPSCASADSRAVMREFVAMLRDDLTGGTR